MHHEPVGVYQGAQSTCRLGGPAEDVARVQLPNRRLPTPDAGSVERQPATVVHVEAETTARAAPGEVALRRLEVEIAIKGVHRWSTREPQRQRRGEQLVAQCCGGNVPTGFDYGAHDRRIRSAARATVDEFTPRRTGIVDGVVEVVVVVEGLLHTFRFEALLRPVQGVDGVLLR